MKPSAPPPPAVPRRLTPLAALAGRPSRDLDRLPAVDRHRGATFNSAV